MAPIVIAASSKNVLLRASNCIALEYFTGRDGGG